MGVTSSQRVQIRYSNTGLANYYGDFIEIHRNLKNNKPLRDYIVKHELGHSVKFDVGHDIKDGLGLVKKPKMFGKLLGFYLKNPSTWTDLLPIQYKKKTFVYDLNLLMMYGLIGLLVYLAIIIF